MLKLTIYTYGLHVLTPLTLWSIPNMVCMATISRTQWLLCYHAHWINLSDFYWAFSSTQWQWWLSYEDYVMLSSGFAPTETRLLMFNLLCWLHPFYQTSREWSALGLYHKLFYVNITCPLGDFIQLLGRITSTHQWPKHYYLYHTLPQNFTHVDILHVNLH